MGKLYRNRTLICLIACIVCYLFTACSLTPSPAPTPTRNRETVDEEIVAALLDSILKDIRAYSLVDVYLIVWSPVQGSQESPDLSMNIEQPIKVWIYEGDQLTEAADPGEAIEQYQQDHMTAAIYGLYDLGILSVAEDGQQAEVYVGFDCGFDCHGHAYYYFLERNEMGQWEDTGTGVYIIE